MTDRRPGPAPGGEPAPDLDAAAERERVRRLRRFSRWAQAGGIGFLAVVSLGLLPVVLGEVDPVAGSRLAVAVWFVAPAIPIALLVVAAFRLPR